MASLVGTPPSGTTAGGGTGGASGATGGSTGSTTIPSNGCEYGRISATDIRDVNLNSAEENSSIDVISGQRMRVTAAGNAAGKTSCDKLAAEATDEIVRKQKNSGSYEDCLRRETPSGVVGRNNNDVSRSPAAGDEETLPLLVSGDNPVDNETRSVAVVKMNSVGRVNCEEMRDELKSVSDDTSDTRVDGEGSNVCRVNADNTLEVDGGRGDSLNFPILQKTPQEGNNGTDIALKEDVKKIGDAEQITAEERQDKTETSLPTATNKNRKKLQHQSESAPQEPLAASAAYCSDQAPPASATRKLQFVLPEGASTSRKSVDERLYGRQSLNIQPRRTQYEKHPLLQGKAATGLSYFEMLLSEMNRGRTATEHEDDELENEDDYTTTGSSGEGGNSRRGKLQPRSAHCEASELFLRTESGLSELELYLLEKEREFSLLHGCEAESGVATPASADGSRTLLEPRTTQYQQHALLEQRDQQGMTAIDLLFKESAASAAADSDFLQAQNEKGKCSSRSMCKNVSCVKCKSQDTVGSTESDSTHSGGGGGSVPTHAIGGGLQPERVTAVTGEKALVTTGSSKSDNNRESLSTSEGTIINNNGSNKGSGEKSRGRKEENEVAGKRDAVDDRGNLESEQCEAGSTVMESQQQREEAGTQRATSTAEKREKFKSKAKTTSVDKSQARASTLVAVPQAKKQSCIIS